ITRPVTAAPDLATTIPSAIKSPANDPWNTVFGCVVALFSASVMRIGITVPEGIVTVLATGGGGGGGAGGTICTGSCAAAGGGGGGGGGALSATTGFWFPSGFGGGGRLPAF